MRIRHLRIGTLEVPLDELDADVLEVGILRLIRDGVVVAEQPAAPFPKAPVHGRMALANDLLPSNRHTLPGGSAYGATGSVEFTATGTGKARLALTVSDLWPVSDGGYYEGWLIHDLTVPMDLDPMDLRALPRYPGGTGNEPGTIFTLDGQPVRTTGGPGGTPNTVWVPVSVGRFNTNATGWARVFTELTHETNLTFSLLELLGMRTSATDEAAEPQDPDSPRECRVGLIPSGIARDILMDAFMRPATVHPEISIRHGLPRRLATIARERLDAFTGDAGSNPGSFMDIGGFNRFAVTREPGNDTRAPGYVPSQRSFVLTGLRG